MSKTPPVPAQNQSPYPIQEPPHDPAAGEAIALAKEMAQAKERRAAGARHLGMGAAIGVGSAAIVAGLLYWRGNRK